MALRLRSIVLVLAVACTHGGDQLRGPALGDSTAKGPSNSSAPLAGSGGVVEVNVPIRANGEPLPADEPGEPADDVVVADAGSPGVFSPPPE